MNTHARKTVALGLFLGLAACYGGPEDGRSSGVGEGADDESGEGTGNDEGTGDGDGDGDGEDGEHEAVSEARDLFPDYPTLHEEVIERTCTPNQGVCHNQKEYPDLRTPQSMLATIGAPCNLAEEDPLEIYNGCEPVGDFVVIDLTPAPEPEPDPFPNPDPDPAPEPEPEPELLEVEVAYVEFILGESEETLDTAVAARVHLRDPIGVAMPSTELATVQFMRLTDTGAISVGMLGSVSWAPGQSMLEVADLSLLGGAELDLLETGIVAGDPNRDGEFGAEGALTMIDPGSPENSYLLQRLQGNVPGSPMPLANQPLSAAEIVALACWIESTAADGAAEDPWLEIDYDACRFAADFGGGSASGGHTLSADVQPIFDQSCAYAGCHGSASPAADLDLTAGAAFDNLMRASMQNPDQQLVEPGNPTNSYLMTKLTGDGVAGEQMPKGAEPLDDTAIGIVRQWISEGAAND